MPKRQNPGPVPRPTLREFGMAALANARALADESTALADLGHAARAFALSVVGIEELAKGIGAWLTLVHGYGPDAPPDTWDTFWELARRAGHAGKIDAGLFLRRVAELEPDEDFQATLSKAIGAPVQQMKLAALYVDLEPGGEVGVPAEFATQGGVEALRRTLVRECAVSSVMVEMAIDNAEPMAGSADAEPGATGPASADDHAGEAGENEPAS